MGERSHTKILDVALLNPQCVLIVRSCPLPEGERFTDLISKINTVFQLLKMHPLGLSGTGYI